MLSLAVTLGCTPATIHRYQQSPVKGKIIGGSEDSLAIEDEWGEQVIRREDITDIDHPGTGLEIIGAIVAVVGTVFFFEHEGDCNNRPIAQTTCLRLVLAPLTGLTMFFGGAEEYRRSEAATADHSLVLEPRRKRRSSVSKPALAPVVNGAAAPQTSPAETKHDGGLATPDAGPAPPPP